MIIDSMVGDKGIAIGSLFSQWDGNFHLTPFDHWMKEDMQIKYYYRYCDDIVILSSGKKYLHNVRKAIRNYLRKELRLELKNNYAVFPVDSCGIDFVGYRHFRKYILLRKSTSQNLIRKMRVTKKKLASGGEFNRTDFGCVNSYNGQLKWCNGYNLYEK